MSDEGGEGWGLRCKQRDLKDKICFRGRGTKYGGSSSQAVMTCKALKGKPQQTHPIQARPFEALNKSC